MKSSSSKFHLNSISIPSQFILIFRSWPSKFSYVFLRAGSQGRIFEKISCGNFCQNFWISSSAAHPGRLFSTHFLQELFVCGCFSVFSIRLCWSAPRALFCGDKTKQNGGEEKDKRISFSDALSAMESPGPLDGIPLLFLGRGAEGAGGSNAAVDPAIRFP